MKIRGNNDLGKDGGQSKIPPVANTISGYGFEAELTREAPASDVPARQEYVVSDPKTLERLARAVRSVAPRSLRNQVDDLTQRALLRLIERDQRMGQECSYCATYLHRTAYCVVIDELRRRQRANRVETSVSQTDQDPRESAVSPDQSPEEMFNNHEAGRAIRDCLSCLAEPRRVAVLLKMQGHAYEEIARVLQCNIKRVNNLVFRGRSALQGCLKEKGF